MNSSSSDTVDERPLGGVRARRLGQLLDAGEAELHRAGGERLDPARRQGWSGRRMEHGSQCDEAGVDGPVSPCHGSGEPSATMPRPSGRDGSSGRSGRARRAGDSVPFGRRSAIRSARAEGWNSWTTPATTSTGISISRSTSHVRVRAAGLERARLVLGHALEVHLPSSPRRKPWCTYASSADGVNDIERRLRGVVRDRLVEARERRTPAAGPDHQRTRTVVPGCIRREHDRFEHHQIGRTATDRGGPPSGGRRRPSSVRKPRADLPVRSTSDGRLPPHRLRTAPSRRGMAVDADRAGLSPWPR